MSGVNLFNKPVTKRYSWFALSRAVNEGKPDQNNAWGKGILLLNQKNTRVSKVHPLSRTIHWVGLKFLINLNAAFSLLAFKVAI